MHLHLTPFFVAALSFALLSCGGQPQPAASDVDFRSREVERVGNLALYQLYSDSFRGLPLQAKRYAYHLTRAAILGRDIAYDQIPPRGLEIRQVLDQLAQAPPSADTEFQAALERYTKKFWAFGGNYDPQTRRKYVPSFTFDQLQGFLRDARINLDPTALERHIFDADYLPMLVNKTPPDGSDPILASAVNLYDHHLTLPDVLGFDSRYPLNSRLAGAGGGIVEEVYRAGAPDVPPGRMAETLGKVALELEAALQFAPSASKPALAKLVEYFRTGEHAAFIEHQRLWVQDTESPIDYIFGFVEVYDDPIATRGTFEAMVFALDADATLVMKALAEHAAWFEERMPWDDAYKKRAFTLPSARAYEVLCATGDGGPLCPVGINLPNFQHLRETVGTKNFLLTNVMETGSGERAKVLFDEFLPTAVEREEALAHRDAQRTLLVALHEVTGHGSGKVKPELKGDPDKYLREYSSTLEEARASLVGYWFIGDHHLVEIGAAPEGLTRTGAFRAMLAWSLIDLRDVPDGDQLEEDHARAGQLIAQFVIDHGGAELTQIAGKHYIRLTDVLAAHKAVGELLAEIQRIKAEGDYEAAARLVNKHAVKFDPELRDEVIQRAAPLGLPERRAFIMPELEAVRNRMGGVTDILIHHTGDFKGQMLRFAGKDSEWASKRVSE